MTAVVQLGLPINVRKALAILQMKRLDAAARRGSISRAESLHGTVRWLMAAQDGTDDDGVSYGYSIYDGWAVSYPETTGYILQTFLWYRELFGGDEVMQRARRMAHWEVDVQMDCGAIPGNYGNPQLVPVAFNTGQVLLGWARYLEQVQDERVHHAAVKAATWLIECMGGKEWFEGGVSAEAEHGNLSYNSMISWGLGELAKVTGNAEFEHAAHASARHYASLVDSQDWPYCAGFSDSDSLFPLTHTLGYSIQGFIEVGRLTQDDALVQTGKRLLEAARKTMNPETGFLPGRIHPEWNGGADWVCLTGSAQFAYSFLRLVLMDREEKNYVALATALIDYVIRTQVTGPTVKSELAYGVRGSYPFRFKGYQAATLPNWAAKFLVDAEMLLYRLGRL